MPRTTQNTTHTHVKTTHSRCHALSVALFETVVVHTDRMRRSLGQDAHALQGQRPRAGQMCQLTPPLDIIPSTCVQSNLGVIYVKGQGVPQDYVEAHKWVNLAASRSTGDDQKR